VSHPEFGNKVIWSVGLGDAHDVDELKAAALVARQLKEAENEGIWGASAARERHVQESGVWDLSRLWELDELYHQDYDCRFDISRHVWSDYMHLFQGIAKQEMLLISAGGMSGNKTDSERRLDARASVMGQHGYFPRGRENHPPYHPSRPK
jgi:hypothetical protein